MKNALLLSIFGLSLALFFTCESEKKEFNFATASEATSYYNVGKCIAEAAEQEAHIQLHILNQEEVDLQLNAINNMTLLTQRKADFVISQNDVKLDDAQNQRPELYENGIRSVLPLYPEIFFLVYRDRKTPRSIRELIVGQKVGFGPETSGTTRFAKNFFSEFGISETEYQPVYREFNENTFSDSVHIACLLTGFNNSRIQKLLAKGGEIFSFGDPNLAGEGSAIDGFCLNYPLARPYILPRRTYGNLPESPILTAAVDAVLFTHENVPTKVVYNLIKTVLEHKQHMATTSQNDLISQINEHFVRSSLRFPLHAGAKQYLDRNEPSFLERYAESAGFLFSLMLAGIGGISTFRRWRKHRKKNRIDLYYQNVLDIEKQIPNCKTTIDCSIAIQNLKSMRETAFQMLIKEKLTADESFRIFITLLNDTIREIEKRGDELHHHSHRPIS